MGEAKNVRRVLPGSSVKDANLRHRAMASAARFVVTVEGTDLVPATNAKGYLTLHE
jgi:hypothetical protein